MFLIKRGFWLVFVEVVIITFAWSFNPFFNIFFLQVIWAIGISMIIMGLLVLLPYEIICVIGLLIVAGHNLMDYPSISSGLKGSAFADCFFSNFYSSLFRGSLLSYHIFISSVDRSDGSGYCWKAIPARNDPVWRRKILLR